MVKEPISRKSDFEAGIVLPIDKPLGCTSADVVRKIKYLLQKLCQKKIKVGHAGTLDPLASGILMICIGKATKMAEALQSEEKEYVAQVTLGATTPSYDLELAIDATYPFEHITREMVEKTLIELSGERLQMPPIYSAKKIEGVRAYEHAREGTQVKLRAALINIYSIELLEYDLPRIKIKITCSKGTYIRSLAHEIGEKLESGAHLSSLCRTRSGGFTLENAYSLDEVKNSLAFVKQN